MNIPKWLNPLTWFARNTTEETAPASSTGQPGNTPRTGGSYALYPLIAGSGEEMSVATVYRCVQLLSESVANLPINLLTLKGDIFRPDFSSRLYYLLNIQPDPALNAFDFWVQVIQRVLLEGNAYIVPIYSMATMDVDRLALCGKGTVSHDIYNDVYSIYDTVNGICGTYDENEVIHIKGHSRDGKHGLSVLTFARLSIEIAEVGDNETKQRFATGGNVRGIVSNDTSVRGFGEYQDEEMDKLAVSLDERFNKNGEHIVGMHGDSSFTQMSMTSADMQFLESRKFTVREICRFFGVHPSFVFDDTSNNYKSAEMANVAFLSNTLNPLLRKIETELRRKLVAPGLAAKKKFEFDRRVLYACDLNSKVKWQQQAMATGLYTVNELRRDENQPPVDGGDIVVVSANLKGIKELSAEPEPAQNINPQNPKGNEK